MDYPRGMPNPAERLTRAESREVDPGGFRLGVPAAREMIRLQEAALADDPPRAPKDALDIEFLRRPPASS